MVLEQSIQQEVNRWLQGSYDTATKTAIQKLLDEGADTELTDAFYKTLEFGTGGLRGIMGVGPNRINKYTIGTATQGLSNYLLKKYPGEKIEVAIAHDSRNNSDLYAGITADVFSANGIYVHFFKALRPTPELSFAIRQLGCKSGVMITASHNPKEYNGYKAYDHYGAQFTFPSDQEVLEEVNNIASIDDVKFVRNDANVAFISEDLDDLFIDKIVALSVSPEAVKRQENLKILYSPLHGTGENIKF